MATDYEKKYKEALERAKRLTSDMTTLQKIREFIFPELAENEDERIRKEIIHYILYKANGVSEKQEHEWIAYLEKQKEQKSGEIPPYVTGIKGEPDPAGVWKPSEEQMEALLSTLHPDDPYYCELRSLYKQLKQL